MLGFNPPHCRDECVDLWRVSAEATVRHGLEDVQFGFDTGGEAFAVHPDGIGQEQDAGSGLPEGCSQQRPPQAIPKKESAHLDHGSVACSAG